MLKYFKKSIPSIHISDVQIIDEQTGIIVVPLLASPSIKYNQRQVWCWSKMSGSIITFDTCVCTAAIAN